MISGANAIGDRWRYSRRWQLIHTQPLFACGAGQGLAVWATSRGASAKGKSAGADDEVARYCAHQGASYKTLCARY